MDFASEGMCCCNHEDETAEAMKLKYGYVRTRLVDSSSVVNVFMHNTTTLFVFD